MNQYFKKFLKINKKIYKEYDKSDKYIFVIDRGRFPHAFQLAVAASALNKKYKSNVLIFSEKKKDSDIINFYKTFGFKNYYFDLSIIFLLIKFNLIIKTTFDSIKAVILIKFFGFEKFINDFKIKDIYVGDLIYDQSIRLEHRYLNPKVDLKFIQILFVTIFKTYDFLIFFEKFKPKLIFTSTSGKAANVGVATRIGAIKKIKVIELSLSQRGTSYFIVHDQKRIKFGKNLMLQKKVKTKEFINYTRNRSVRFLNQFINKRSKANTVFNLTGPKDLKNDKSQIFLNRDKLLNKINIRKNEKIRKIVLIAPHAFSDAPHDSGLDMIFTDYYSHLKETLLFVNQEADTKNILWLVKPHPSSAVYNENGIVERLVKKINNSKIIMCPKNISSFNLSFICDHVITLRGSIGLEFACQGKYSIIAGIAHYSNLGLSLEPKNKKKYFSFIKNIMSIKKLKRHNL